MLGINLKLSNLTIAIRRNNALIQRFFARLDPVLNGHGTMQTAVVIPNNFRVSALCVLTASATTVSLLGQAASALNYLKVLSTGFASLSIDGSIVTSTVLATKDNRIRTYGVELSGDDFIFQENGVTIDTVTDAVAAAKTLTLEATGQSNGADFFDGIFANITLTDLVTAANSESWKGDKDGATTTEQSSSGNNIWTRVNVVANDVGLFTLDTSVMPNRWVGKELVDDVGFSGNGWWSIQEGASISGGVGSADGTQGNNAKLFRRQGLVVEGSNYQTSMEVVTVSIGEVRLRVGNGIGAIHSTTGVFTEDQTATTSTELYVQSAGLPSFIGSIDNVSVKQFIEVAS